MSCHAILKNLYEPKMDVILTISFKITAEIEIIICYLIKCNSVCFQSKDSILNMWINNLNFYHFLQFTVGKPELITTCRNDHFPNNVPTSSFYRLMVIIAFQHVNRTFNVIFDSFKSRGLTNVSINRMFRSITIF